MNNLPQDESDSFLGISSFSQLCDSTPEGAVADATQQIPPGYRPCPATSLPQSLTLGDGLQLACASTEEDSALLGLHGTHYLEIGPSSPIKTTRQIGGSDAVERAALRGAPPHPPYIESKASSSSNDSSRRTAASAFHSTGLAAITAAVAAAAAAEAKNAGGRVRELKGPTPRSSLWLRPSEFSLLAKLRARADAATATQIQTAAAAAAAAFRSKGLVSPATAAAVAAERTAPSTGAATAAVGGAPSHAGTLSRRHSADRPEASSSESSSGRSAEGTSSCSFSLSLSASDKVIDPPAGSSSCNDDQTPHRSPLPGDAEAPDFLAVTRIVQGTWSEVESQGGPRGTAWRVYTPDAAECCSSSCSSCSSLADAEGLKEQRTEGVAEKDEGGFLPPTQKREGDGTPPPASAVATAATDCNQPVASLRSGPDSHAAAAAAAAAPGTTAAAGGRDGRAYSASLTENNTLLESLSSVVDSGAVGYTHTPAVATELDAARLRGRPPSSRIPQCLDSSAAAANPTSAPGTAETPTQEPEMAGIAHSRWAPCSSPGLLSAPSAQQHSQMNTSAAPRGAAATTMGASSMTEEATERSGGNAVGPDEVACPYRTPTRRRRGPAGPGLVDGPPSGPPSPSPSSSSAYRRGRLKSTARLPASSLSRAAVEATARRFSRLPFGGDAPGSGPSSPLKKRRGGRTSQPEGEGTDGSSNRNTSTSNSVDTTGPSAAAQTHDMVGPPGRPPPVKRERPPSSISHQQQDLLPPLATKEEAPSSGMSGSHGEERGSVLLDAYELPVVGQVEAATPGSPPQASESAEGLSDPESPCCSLGDFHLAVEEAPVSSKQLEDVLNRGLYGFQVEGLLWMLEREGRLPVTGSESSPGPEPSSSLSQRDPPIKTPLFRGGILADDPGLGKTMQMISLVAATLRSPLTRTPAGAPQLGVREQVQGTQERRSLVLVPASLVPQWEAEIHRICGMKVGVLNIPRRLRDTGTQQFALLLPFFLFFTALILQACQHIEREPVSHWSE